MGGHSAPLSDPSELGPPPEPSKCPQRDPPTLPQSVHGVCSRRGQHRGTLQDNHGAGGDLLARAWPAQQEAAITRRGLSPHCFIRQHPHVFILRQHKSLVINEANESPTVAISFLVRMPKGFYTGAGAAASSNEQPGEETWDLCLAGLCAAGCSCRHLPWANFSRHNVPDSQGDQVGGDGMVHLEDEGVVLLLLPGRGAHHRREALGDLETWTKRPSDLCCTKQGVCQPSWGLHDASPEPSPNHSTGDKAAEHSKRGTR